MIDRRTAPYAALLLRVAVGSLFILHIYRKFFITGVDAWWENLAHSGYPKVVMIYALAAEFSAAVALPLGLWTRWVSLLALPLIAGEAHFWLIRRVRGAAARACVPLGQSACLTFDRRSGAFLAGSQRVLVQRRRR